MRVCSWLLWVLAWGWTGALAAAVPEMPRFRIIDAMSQLPSSTITAMAQDRAGYLWLATDDGLARYDGSDFKVWHHDPADPQSLAGNLLQALYIDRQDRIWVASVNNGISMLDAARQRFKHFNHASHPQIAQDDVMALGGRGDEIWFGTEHGSVYRIDAAERISRYELTGMAEPLPAGPVAAVAVDGQGRVWFGGPDGLASFDGTGLRREWLPDAEAGVYMLAWSGGLLWAGSSSGIYQQGADGHWRAPSWGARFARQDVAWAVASDDMGGFWLGSESGLWRGEPGRAPVRVRDGDQPLVADRLVPSLLWQRDGGLWLPVHGRGLAYLRPDWRRTAVFKPEPARTDGVYCGLTPTADGAGLWQLDEHGEPLRLDVQNGKLLRTGRRFPALRSTLLTAALEDRRGRLWLGNLDSGLARLDLVNGGFRQWFSHGAEAVPEYGAPEWLVEAADGSVWLSSLGQLQRRDGDSGRVLDRAKADVEQLGLGPDGQIWIAGGEGVQGWQTARRRFEPVAGLQGGRVYGFVVAGEDELWLHRMSGLEQWHRQGAGWTRMAVIGPLQGLPAVESQGIQLDPAGRLWLATRRGLWRVDPTGPKPRLRSFGLRDGLSSREFIDGCLRMAAGGVLVAATADGYITLLDTLLPEASSWTPELALANVSVLRQGQRRALPDSGGFTLAADDRQFQVAARLLVFGDPDGNHYRSWLHGLDSGWVEQGRAGLREFSALPPGRYTLDVQGVDPFGNASRPRRLQFTVAPPWWRSATGLTLLSLLAGVLVAVLTALYRRRLRARSQWQLEQHKRALAEQASQAKTRFLATLGHEVRTPMTGVLGMAELLLATPLDARQRDYAGSILSAGRHLLRLVNDALDLARIEAGKLPLEARDFDLRELLEQICALVRPMALSKQLAFDFELEPGLPPTLQGDSNRVQQILLNLLVNAIKFTAHGRVGLRVRRPAGVAGVVFEVADTGPGIGEEQRQRLFQRFEQGEGARTAARYGGSGLGLAISHELAIAMGGRIEVESTPGKGTCFRVELALPWSSEAIVSTVADGVAGAVAVAPPLRLLLVEDDATVAQVIIGLLRLRGHDVVHVGHGLAALAELAGPAAIEFDACLCDLDLPGLDGLALIRQLRACGHQLPVIAITARSDAGIEAQALRAGFDAFLRKPLSGEVLAQALATLRRRPSAHVDEHVERADNDRSR